MRDFMAVAGFYAISLVLFPISLRGYLIWIGQAFLTWRKSAVSGTAQGPLSARCVLSYPIGFDYESRIYPSRTA